MNTILSIIRSVNVKHISPIVQLLLDEKIQDIEISLSDGENGLECIRELDKNFRVSTLNLGVGTVINKQQVDLSLKAGAKYIIMPGWERDLVRYILGLRVEVIPGVLSPSEVMQAVNEGLNLLKLFPAGSVGIGYLKSLFGPFPDIKVIAVGGVNSQNARDFIDAGCVTLGIGSELVPRGATGDDLEKIRANIRTFFKAIGRTTNTKE